MPKSNFLFFLNSYNDLCQTSTPALNQFRWSREINGVPYTLSNSQEIQVLPSTTSGNILPYNFSTPTTTITATTDSTTSLVTTSFPTNIAEGQLIVGDGIPAGTTVDSVGSTQYTFTTSSANATMGAVYSNNGQTFAVTSTIVAGTTLLANGSGNPTASGTLTLVSGTGDATITFSAFTESTTIIMSQAATSSGSPSVSFYNPASFIYLESDQAVSMIYNNGSPMALNPFQINGITVPGVFFMNGPVYSVTITNPGAVTANVYFASMG